MGMGEANAMAPAKAGWRSRGGDETGSAPPHRAPMGEGQKMPFRWRIWALPVLHILDDVGSYLRCLQRIIQHLGVLNADLRILGGQFRLSKRIQNDWRARTDAHAWHQGA